MGGAKGAAISHQSRDNSVEQCRCEQQGNSFGGLSSITPPANFLWFVIPNVDKYGSLPPWPATLHRYRYTQHISSDGTTQHY